MKGAWLVLVLVVSAHAIDDVKKIDMAQTLDKLVAPQALVELEKVNDKVGAMATGIICGVLALLVFAKMGFDGFQVARAQVGDTPTGGSSSGGASNDCNLPNIAHSTFHAGKIAHLGSKTGTCSFGLKQTITVTCNDGQIMPALPTCPAPRDCDLPNIAHSTIKAATVGQGDHSGRCLFGGPPKQIITVTCNDGALNRPLPTCPAPRGCTTKLVANSNIQAGEALAHGASKSGNCEHGDKSPIVQTCNDGETTNVPLQCPGAAVVIGGGGGGGGKQGCTLDNDIAHSDIKAGHIAHGKTKDGFCTSEKPHRAISVTCNDGALGALPTCKRGCVLNNDIAHSTVKKGPIAHGGETTGTCTFGDAPKQSIKVTCNDGSHEDPLPTCPAPRGCTLVDDILNSDIKKGHIVHGEKAGFCTSEEPRRAITVTCNDGALGALPTCLRGCKTKAVGFSNIVADVDMSSGEEKDGACLHGPKTAFKLKCSDGTILNNLMGSCPLPPISGGGGGGSSSSDLSLCPVAEMEKSANGVWATLPRPEEAAFNTKHKIQCLNRLSVDVECKQKLGGFEITGNCGECKPSLLEDYTGGRWLGVEARGASIKADTYDMGCLGGKTIKTRCLRSINVNPAKAGGATCHCRGDLASAAAQTNFAILAMTPPLEKVPDGAVLQAVCKRSYVGEIEFKCSAGVIEKQGRCTSVFQKCSEDYKTACTLLTTGSLSRESNDLTLNKPIRSFLTTQVELPQRFHTDVAIANYIRRCAVKHVAKVQADLTEGTSRNPHNPFVSRENLDGCGITHFQMYACGNQICIPHGILGDMRVHCS